MSEVGRDFNGAALGDLRRSVGELSNELTVYQNSNPIVGLLYEDVYGFGLAQNKSVRH